MSQPARQSIDPVQHFSVCICTGRPLVIALRGELDLASVASFVDAYHAADLASATDVVLDLRHLAFIDATGLRAVLALHALCLEWSVALLIRPGCRGVQRVFELTGTDGLLPFASTSGQSSRRSSA